MSPNIREENSPGPSGTQKSGGIASQNPNPSVNATEKRQNDSESDLWTTVEDKKKKKPPVASDDKPDTSVSSGQSKGETAVKQNTSGVGYTAAQTLAKARKLPSWRDRVNKDKKKSQSESESKPAPSPEQDSKSNSGLEGSKYSSKDNDVLMTGNEEQEKRQNPAPYVLKRMKVAWYSDSDEDILPSKPKRTKVSPQISAPARPRVNFDQKLKQVSSSTSSTGITKSQPNAAVPSVEDVLRQVDKAKARAVEVIEEAERIHKRTTNITRAEMQKKIRERRLSLCAEILFQAVKYDIEVERTLDYVLEEFETLGKERLIPCEELEKLMDCLSNMSCVVGKRGIIVDPLLSATEEMMKLLESFGISVKYKTKPTENSLAEIEGVSRLKAHIQNWLDDENRIQITSDPVLEAVKERVFTLLDHFEEVLASIVQMALERQKIGRDLRCKREELSDPQFYREAANKRIDVRKFFFIDVDYSLDVRLQELKENLDLLQQASLEPEQIFQQKRDEVLLDVRAFAQFLIPSLVEKYLAFNVEHEDAVPHPHESGG